MKKAMGIISDILIFLLFSFSVLVAFSAAWMLKTWPNLKMDELIYMVSQGFSGTGGDMVHRFISSCELPMGLCMLIAASLMILMRHEKKGLLRFDLILISVCCLVISAASVYTQVGVGDYIVSQTTESEFIKDNYADPSEVTMVFPEQKRNLIYIYLESMEVTFADVENGGAFEKNTIVELTQLAEENECFSGEEGKLNGGYSLPNTTWTMGAMFGQTSGLPLQISINGNAMDTQEEFFPGATVLGDILEDEGYKNVLLIGSDAEFGGRENYFTSHGNYEIRDYKYANENGLIPKDYYVWWGYEDNKLISIAKDTLNELSASDQPFNLTMLTVDTHFEDGWLCEDCPDTFGSDQYANVIACSSKKITEFVRWCQSQPWYENTTIILSGDHPTMDVDFCDGIDENYERKVYTAYINSAVENADSSRTRIYSTLDHFPTTLASLGVYIEGDRLGLGTNLFSMTETLTEKYGKEDETALLKQKSKFMEQLSGVSISAKDLYESGKTLVKADIRVKNYDAETGILSLNADDILIGNCAAYRVLFTAENESGTVFYEGEVQPDGSYSADLYIPPDQLSSTNLRIGAVYKQNGKLEGGAVFGYGGDNLLYIGSLQDNAAGFIDTLNTLDHSRYTIFMSVKGDVSAGITDEIQNSLYAMGVKTDLRNSPGISYAFVKDQSGVLEYQSYSYLEKYGYTSSWKPFIVISSAASTGNTASIMINNGGYTDYCLNKPGLNFVVWDNVENQAVCTASFDTTSSLPAADLLIPAIDADSSHAILTVRNIENAGDVRKVNGVIWSNENPADKQAFTFEQDEDVWMSKLDTSQINIKDCTIRLYVSDLSNRPAQLMEIRGSLYDYQTAHPVQEYSTE